MEVIAGDPARIGADIGSTGETGWYIRCIVRGEDFIMQVIAW